VIAIPPCWDYRDFVMLIGGPMHGGVVRWQLGLERLVMYDRSGWYEPTPRGRFATWRENDGAE
jgi:hypothetical protein